MIRGAAAAALVLVMALPARAVTIHDLVALSRAGLSDQVLIALIQTDQTIYGVDAKQVLELKKAGVSEPVILALLRNGRQPSQPPSAAPAPTPAPAQPDTSAPIQEQAPIVTIIGDHSHDAEEASPPPAESNIVVVPSAVPVFVPVVVGRTGRGHRRQGDRRGVGQHRGPASLTVGPPPMFPGLNSISGGHAHTGGGSITADGWRFVTPRIVPAHVPGQH